MILITGAGGQLGSAIAAAPGCLGLTRDDLDLCDTAAVIRALDAHQPDVIINCAAWTDVAGAENNREAAWSVNAEAPCFLAAICRERKVRLVHLSTDYAAWPLGGVYHASKAAGEIAATLGAVVVRVQWLYTASSGFVAAALERMGVGEEIRLVVDQAGCPTPARSLVEPLLAIAQAEPGSRWELATRGECSYFDWVREAAAIKGVPFRARRVLRATLAGPQRPARSVLDPGPAEEAFDLKMPHWRDALESELKSA